VTKVKDKQTEHHRIRHCFKHSVYCTLVPVHSNNNNNNSNYYYYYYIRLTAFFPGQPG